MKDLVVKSNRLNSSIQNLSKAEIRMIQLAIVDARETGLGLSADKPLAISAERFADVFGTTKENAYARMKEAEESLFNRRFSFEDNRGVLIKSRWISQVAYLDGEGAIEVYFTPAVVHEITRLDGKEQEQAFTKYFIENTKNFKSGYSIRLYELLIQWKTAAKTPLFALEEFRGQLGLDASEYKQMCNFKTRVLGIAVKEINEKSDIKVDYTQVKKGRKIVGFTFTVKEKMEKKQTGEMVADVTRPLNQKQASKFADAIVKYCLKHKKKGIVNDLGRKAPSHIGSAKNWYDTKNDIEKELMCDRGFWVFKKILLDVGYKEYRKENDS